MEEYINRAYGTVFCNDILDPWSGILDLPWRTYTLFAKSSGVASGLLGLVREVRWAKFTAIREINQVSGRRKITQVLVDPESVSLWYSSSTCSERTIPSASHPHPQINVMKLYIELAKRVQ
jgi:hypothetical protein